MFSNLTAVIDARLSKVVESINERIDERIEQTLEDKLTKFINEVTTSYQFESAVEDAVDGIDMNDKVDIDSSIDAYMSDAFDIEQYVDIEEMVRDAVVDVEERVDELESKAHEHDD